MNIITLAFVPQRETEGSRPPPSSLPPPPPSPHGRRLHVKIILLSCRGRHIRPFRAYIHCVRASSIGCAINERRSTRGDGTRVSAACVTRARACARYDAREQRGTSEGDGRVYTHTQTQRDAAGVARARGMEEPTNMAIIHKCKREERGSNRVGKRRCITSSGRKEEKNPSLPFRRSAKGANEERG